MEAAQRELRVGLVVGGVNGRADVFRRAEAGGAVGGIGEDSTAVQVEFPIATGPVRGEVEEIANGGDAARAFVVRGVDAGDFNGGLKGELSRKGRGSEHVCNKKVVVPERTLPDRRAPGLLLFARRRLAIGGEDQALAVGGRGRVELVELAVDVGPQIERLSPAASVREARRGPDVVLPDAAGTIGVEQQELAVGGEAGPEVVILAVDPRQRLRGGPLIIPAVADKNVGVARGLAPDEIQLGAVGGNGGLILLVRRVERRVQRLGRRPEHLARAGPRRGDAQLAAVGPDFAADHPPGKGRDSEPGNSANERPNNEMSLSRFRGSGLRVSHDGDPLVPSPLVLRGEGVTAR